MNRSLITTQITTPTEVNRSTYMLTDYIKEGFLKLNPDTVKTGIRFNNKKFTTDELIELREVLTTLESNKNVDVIRYEHPKKKGKKKFSAYRKTLIIKPKNDTSDEGIYVHIAFEKNIILRYPYDVVFSSHLSWTEEMTRVLTILEDADPKGVLRKFYLNSTISRLDLKFDILGNDLNFFLKRFDCCNSSKPHVIKNKETGRRTFKITRDIYFYEKGLPPQEKVRLEIRFINRKKIERFFPNLTIEEVLEGRWIVPRDVFKGWVLIEQEGLPETPCEERIERIIKATLQSIDVLGNDAQDALLKTKIEINRQSSGKGKFNERTKTLYKRERFYDDYLLSQKFI